MAIKTHGLSKTRAYKSYHSMVDRCCNPNHISFPHYRGNDINICDKWKGSVEAFFKDMGERPLGHTLDRIDNKKGYYLENCRWATVKTQERNKDNNVLLTAYGVTACLAEWCETLEVPRGRLSKRIRKGLSDHEVLFNKVQENKRPARLRCS